MRVDPRRRELLTGSTRICADHHRKGIDEFWLYPRSSASIRVRKIFVYASAAMRGSAAPNTPETTATKSAPASTSGRALSLVMPPIATSGTPSARASRKARVWPAAPVVWSATDETRRTRDSRHQPRRARARGRGVVTRHADDRVRAEACPRGGEVAVVLTKMHARRSDRLREFDIVVDDQWHLPQSAQLAQPRRLLPAALRVGRLVAVLQHYRATAQRRLDDGEQVRAGSVRYRVKAAFWQALVHGA